MLTVHLFVSYAHVKLCHFFSSSWSRGSAAASACGSFWTFLFTFILMETNDQTKGAIIIKQIVIENKGHLEENMCTLPVCQSQK